MKNYNISNFVQSLNILNNNQNLKLMYQLSIDFSIFIRYKDNAFT